MSPLPLGILASASGGLPIVTGGTLSSDSTYYYRTFTSTSTLEVLNGPVQMDFFLSNGGDGGVLPNVAYNFGSGGQGGNFQVRTATFNPGSHTITVGAGGAAGSSGTNSSIFNVSSTQTASGSGGTAGPGNIAPTGAGGDGASVPSEWANVAQSKAGGGGGGANGQPNRNPGGQFGGGSGGLIDQGNATVRSGLAGYLGGGGGGGTRAVILGTPRVANAGPGGSGQVVVRYLKSAVGG